jgi:ribosomal protein S27E
VRPGGSGAPATGLTAVDTDQLCSARLPVACSVVGASSGRNARTIARGSASCLYGAAHHRPEQTLLYQLVEAHYPAFLAAREAADRPLPKYVQREFEAYLRCGRFEHGFLRVRCESCHAEKLVAFSCKGRAVCPSCGARRMAETAALLADEVLPRRPMRQWVLSLPFALRFLLARDPEVLTQVLAIVYRAIAGHILNRARLMRAAGNTGAVTLIQRFGSALNLLKQSYYPPLCK